MLIILLQMGKQVLVIAVLVLLVLGVGGWFLMNSNKTQTSNSEVVQTTSQPDSDTVTTNNTSTSDSTSSGQVKELTVTGSSFKFEPSNLTVNKGDKVKITFKNSGGMHNFVIDEFNVKTKVIPAGQEEVVEFTADKAGTFEFYCGVGNHRAMGMKGMLEVK